MFRGSPRSKRIQTGGARIHPGQVDRIPNIAAQCRVVILQPLIDVISYQNTERETLTKELLIFEGMHIKAEAFQGRAKRVEDGGQGVRTGSRFPIKLDTVIVSLGDGSKPTREQPEDIRRGAVLGNDEVVDCGSGHHTRPQE